MDSLRTKNKIYLRVDKDEEILTSILNICQCESIRSATFHGIEACCEAVTATYLPDRDDFLDHSKKRMLELISLDGNITHDEDMKLFVHAHALFSFLNNDGKIEYFGGHLKSATVGYTAEIVIDPVESDDIGRMVDPVTGITVWKLS